MSDASSKLTDVQQNQHNTPYSTAADTPSLLSSTEDTQGLQRVREASNETSFESGRDTEGGGDSEGGRGREGDAPESAASGYFPPTGRFTIGTSDPVLLRTPLMPIATAEPPPPQQQQEQQGTRGAGDAGGAGVIDSDLNFVGTLGASHINPPTMPRQDSQQTAGNPAINSMHKIQPLRDAHTGVTAPGAAPGAAPHSDVVAETSAGPLAGSQLSEEGQDHVVTISQVSDVSTGLEDSLANRVIGLGAAADGAAGSTGPTGPTGAGPGSTAGAGSIARAGSPGSGTMFGEDDGTEWKVLLCVLYCTSTYSVYCTSTHSVY
jgi:hypothetical protein